MRPVRPAVRVLSLTAMSCLAACVVGPNYRKPALPTSAGYGQTAVSPPGPENSAVGAPRLVPGMEIPKQWWRVFRCAELDNMVAEALNNSPTLEAAKQALRAAQEQVKAQRGVYYPSVNASLQPSHQNFAETLASPAQSGVSIYNLTTTQVSVAYTPDLFGANHRAVESLVAQADQQRFELEAARLTLASNVAQAAIQDASLRAQIATTQVIIEEQKRTLASFQRQAELGAASKADLATQEALLAQTEATLPALQKAYRVNRDLLSALMGKTPGEPAEVHFDFAALTLPEQLPLSLPAQLVEQRPDVRIAEAALHSASAQVGVAVAARLPNLQIEANAGSAALGLVPAFNSASNFWNVAATLTQPIFEGGTLLHRQRAAEATYDQVAAQYRATVVGAFQNTADVLHALWTDADALRAGQAAEEASHRSLDIARRQLGLGDVSQLVLLSAEESEQQTELAVLQAKANRYSDVVALFQALGGGWWNSSTPVTEPGS